MYKTALVKADIEDGRRVIDEIEKIIPITAAFWFYREEDDEWKLMVVSPDVEARGPINLYTRIDVLLNGVATDFNRPLVMPLSRISVTNTPLSRHQPHRPRLSRAGVLFGRASNATLTRVRILTVWALLDQALVSSKPDCRERCLMRD
jgi:hypothetical protein